MQEILQRRCTGLLLGEHVHLVGVGDGPERHVRVDGALYRRMELSRADRRNGADRRAVAPVLRGSRGLNVSTRHSGCAQRRPLLIASVACQLCGPLGREARTRESDLPRT